jgi:single-strand DNA-binding protein
MAKFSVATSESWRDKATGEKREAVEWHTVICFNEPLSKVIEMYCKKGSKVYVQGALRTRKWQDKDGNDRWSTEVVMSNFDSKLVLLTGKDSDGGGKNDYSSYDKGAGGAGGKAGSGANGANGSGAGKPAGNSNSNGGAQYQQQNYGDDEIPF